MKIAVCFLSVLFLSCVGENRQCKKENPLVFEERLHAIIDSFTMIYPDRRYYELYIKTHQWTDSPAYATMLLYGGDKPYKMRNEIPPYFSSPINSVFINGLKIEIYSGVEIYVNQKKHYIDDKIVKNSDQRFDRDAFWYIIDSCGLLRAGEKGQINIPVFPPPLNAGVEFLPPEIIDN